MSTSELPSPGTERPEDIEAVPVRRPGRWIASVIILIVAASLIRAIVVNPHFEWGIVGDFLFDSRILQGVRITIELTVISMAVGIVLGVLLAVMRLSPNPLVSG
ncbi:MAG: amino acid ABC transporter permease, partial [Solirubrobacteraceae bacterium]